MPDITLNKEGEFASVVFETASARTWAKEFIVGIVQRVSENECRIRKQSVGFLIYVAEAYGLRFRLTSAYFHGRYHAAETLW